MNSNSFADETQLAALGKHVLAARVPGGLVPDHCVGLSIEGALTQRYPSGKKLNAPHHGKLWWVSLSTFELRFAPVVAAPEAGISLVLEASAASGLVVDRLAYWLDAHVRPFLATEDIATELHGSSLLQIPPCLQREEKLALCDGLSAALIPRMGIRCKQLERIDLYPEVDCAGVIQDTEKPEQNPAEVLIDDISEKDPASENKVAPNFASRVLSNFTDVQAKYDRNDSAKDTKKLISRAIALDDRFAQRLFMDLPNITERLRAITWPDDDRAFDAHRSILNRFEHLASTTGRLPSLSSRLDPHELDLKTIKLLVAESEHAAQFLDQTWAVIAGQNDAAITSPKAQKNLEQIATNIELAIARRRTPWWLA